MELKKKEFTYRGKTIEELKALDVREFAKHLRSRQRRNVLRQFQKIEDFVSRAKTKIEKGKNIRTHQRDLVIVPGLVGMRIQVHDGRNFAPVDVVGEMLGHVLGEFALTRGRIKHGKSGVGATKGTKHKSKK
ncbi:MAG TPA: 30S ribosomal protein S19 [Candidatus Pacearchaeota archaeon]|nr:30S ribosomal protein S19 [Candidatus Pacearchaeota archaeon]